MTIIASASLVGMVGMSEDTPKALRRLCIGIVTVQGGLAVYTTRSQTLRRLSAHTKVCSVQREIMSSSRPKSSGEAECDPGEGSVGQRSGAQENGWRCSESGEKEGV